MSVYIPHIKREFADSPCFYAIGPLLPSLSVSRSLSLSSIARKIRGHQTATRRLYVSSKKLIASYYTGIKWVSDRMPGEMRSPFPSLFSPGAFSPTRHRILSLFLSFSPSPSLFARQCAACSVAVVTRPPRNNRARCFPLRIRELYFRSAIYPFIGLFIPCR